MTKRRKPARPDNTALTTACVTLELATVEAEEAASRAHPEDDYFARKARDLRAVEEWLEYLRMGGAP